MVFKKEKFLILEVEAEEDVTKDKKQPFVFWKDILELDSLEDYDYFVRKQLNLIRTGIGNNVYREGTLLFKRVKPIREITQKEIENDV